VKALRQISTATILSLMLAISVFGGHIETPGAPAPHSTTSTTDGTTDATDATTEIVLTIVSVTYP
jgi:hypothetical protein